MKAMLRYLFFRILLLGLTDPAIIKYTQNCYNQSK